MSVSNEPVYASVQAVAPEAHRFHTPGVDGVTVALVEERSAACRHHHRRRPTTVIFRRCRRPWLRHEHAKIIRWLVCSLFARLPRYRPSLPGTNRQGFELKSAQSGTDRH